MSNKNRRISSKVDEFNTEITTMDDRFNAASTDTACPAMNNGTCLGVTAADITAWHDRRLAWAILYGQYQNPSTRPQVDGANGDVAVFIRSFQQFSEPILNTVANSTHCTSDLANVFHVVPVALRKNPTHHTEPILEDCFASINALGGGALEFTVRADHDTKRSSKPEGVSGIEIAYKIGLTPPVAPNPPDDAPGVESPDACDHRIIRTKSHFVLQAGPASATKKLYAFARWYDVNNPERSGQWSSMYTVPIA